MQSIIWHDDFLVTSIAMFASNCQEYLKQKMIREVSINCVCVVSSKVINGVKVIKLLHLGSCADHGTFFVCISCQSHILQPRMVFPFNSPVI